VRVDVRFVEVNRNDLLNWESAFSAEWRDFNGASRYRPETYTVNDDGQIVPALGGRTGNPDFRNILGFLGGRLTNQFGISGDHWDVESLLSVLETENIVRTLSSPSLTVLSGEVAEFNTGGRIPVDQTVFAGTGVAETSVTFVEFGVRLAIRPLVDEDDYITLDLVPELSDPDPRLTEQILLSSGTNPPTTAFSQRGLRTTTRLRDGQSLLIGGLTEHSRSDDSGRTPWLHELPLLGWLFKDFTYRDSDRDLVIMVNPSIVRAEPELANLWIYPESEARGAQAAAAETTAEPGGAR
jgi:Flp pilus assembly secretin CpaC